MPVPGSAGIPAGVSAIGEVSSLTEADRASENSKPKPPPVFSKADFENSQIRIGFQIVRLLYLATHPFTLIFFALRF